MAWHILAAKRHIESNAGVLFRGVGQLFNFVPLATYRPGNLVTWSAFSSCSVDLRIATKFMHGTQETAAVEGVIFKIWTRSGSPIWWASFAPHEREVLFNPNVSFRVLNWYPATEVNLRHGTRMETRKERAFVLDCDHIVHPVPLQHVSTDEALRRQLKHHQVLLIEMEEESVAEEEEYEEASTDLGFGSRPRASTGASSVSD